jgi:hypothetical protein
MKKNKKKDAGRSGGTRAGTRELPIKNPATDDTKNIAVQTPGLNQAKTTSDNLFPSDGDNLTN